MATAGMLEPRQQRSRDTSARLLKATLEALEQHGLEGATIPRIAAAAGVASASVYRRFRDRDALYRAALMQALEESAEAARATIRLESFPQHTLGAVVAEIVALTIRQYQMRPGIMRALTRFVETDVDPDFRSRALAIVRANTELLVELLLGFRREIGHRNPRRAVTFALLTMATIVEVRAMEPVSLWHELLPNADRTVQTELTAMMLAYLRSPARP